MLVTLTLGTSMAARQGSIPMAAHQICLQVWLAVSLLTDSLALAGQVSMNIFLMFVIYRYHFVENYLSRDSVLSNNTFVPCLGPAGPTIVKFCAIYICFQMIPF